jgi:hypothetical protein
MNLFCKDSDAKWDEEYNYKILTTSLIVQRLIEIIDNKYILNITCSTWNKISDIELSLQTMRNYYNDKKKNNNESCLISFDDAYDFYSKFCNIFPIN